MVKTAEEEVWDENFTRDISIVGKQVVDQLNRFMEDRKFEFRILEENLFGTVVYAFIPEKGGAIS